jgi:hypothetical protein
MHDALVPSPTLQKKSTEPRDPSREKPAGRDSMARPHGEEHQCSISLTETGTCMVSPTLAVKNPGRRPKTKRICNKQLLNE